MKASTKILFAHPMLMCGNNVVSVVAAAAMSTCALAASFRHLRKVG